MNQQIVNRNVLLMEKVFLSQRKESRRKKREKIRGAKNHLCTRWQKSYRIGISDGAKIFLAVLIGS